MQGAHLPLETHSADLLAHMTSTMPVISRSHDQGALPGHGDAALRRAASSDWVEEPPFIWQAHERARHWSRISKGAAFTRMAMTMLCYCGSAFLLHATRADEVRSGLV